MSASPVGRSGATFSSWRVSDEAPLHGLFLLHFVFAAWSHLGGWAADSLWFQVRGRNFARFSLLLLLSQMLTIVLPLF